MKKSIIFLSVIVLLTSCKDTWNEDDKQTFHQACMDDAKTWAGSEDKAKAYCDCVFEKMEKKYPNENEALEHINELSKDTSLQRCKAEVMK